MKIGHRTWYEDKKRFAAEAVKEEKRKARRQVEMLPFGRATKAVLLVMQNLHFHWRRIGDGCIRKPLADIAKRAGVTERTVRRALRELEENGVVECVRQGRGRGVLSVYRVCRFVIKTAAVRIDEEIRRRKSEPRNPLIATAEKTGHSRAFSYNSCTKMLGGWVIGSPKRSRKRGSPLCEPDWLRAWREKKRTAGTTPPTFNPA